MKFNFNLSNRQNCDRLVSLSFHSVLTAHDTGAGPGGGGGECGGGGASTGGTGEGRRVGRRAAARVGDGTNGGGATSHGEREEAQGEIWMIFWMSSSPNLIKMLVIAEFSIKSSEF